jgi:two-component system response regulator AtoC
MSTQRPQVLIVEDQEEVLFYCKVELEKDGSYDVQVAQTIRQATKKLQSTKFHVVLTDLQLQTSRQGGFELLEEIKKNTPETQVIIFTGIGGTDDARFAQRHKADGYLTKPLDFDNLRLVVTNCIQERERRATVRERMLSLPTPEKFVGVSENIKQLKSRAASLARTTKNIMIVGAPGTGKGLLAEGIHFGSRRSHLELVSCSSLSESTLDNLLFGKYDVDTGPYQHGLLKRLSEGTLILDQVSSLSLALQQRLLSALRDGAYQTHEETEVIAIDLRIIALEDTDLQELISQGFFLPELYEILAEEQLYVPSLNERRDNDGRYEDILLLAEHFLEKYSTLKTNETLSVRLSAEVETILEQYPFPGNVRELQSVIRTALGNLAENSIILPEHLPQKLQNYYKRTTLGVSPEQDTLPLLCPHRAFQCNQTSAIASTYNRFPRVYLRLSQKEAQFLQSIQHQIEGLGMAVFQAERLKDAPIAMCDICVPIQSSRYAVIDLTTPNEQLYYELGLLHALGIPVLALRNINAKIPSRFDPSSFREYTNEGDIMDAIKHWLSGYI